MRLIIVTLLTYLLVSGCLKNEENISNPSEDWVQVSPTTFGITDHQNSNITISMTQNCGSACWIEFDDRVSRSGNTYDITTLALRGSEICAEQCVLYTRSYEIDLPNPGDYTFRYFVNDTTAAIITYTLN